MKRNIKIKTVVVFGVLLSASLITNYVIAAWSMPSATPPSGNVAGPITVGATTQTKEGGLILNNSGADSSTGLEVKKGGLLVGGGLSQKLKSGSAKGYITAKDVWVDEAVGGQGAWVSDLLTGASGGGASSAWVEIPTTDTALWDENCNYKIMTSLYSYWMGGGYNNGIAIYTGAGSCGERAIWFSAKGSTYIGCYAGGEAVTKIYMQCPFN